jgi:hypothetical protein
MTNALVLTYAKNLKTQSELPQCATAQALVDWCIRRARSMGGQLYFLIDQMNALDTDPDSLNSVSIDERQQCAKFIAQSLQVPCVRQHQSIRHIGP